MAYRAHIGFYERDTDKIGDFFSLFFLPDGGEPENFLPAFEQFTPHIREGIELIFAPQLMAEKLGHYLWLEGRPGKVELAKDLNPQVDFFYKVVLSDVYTLEVYQVEYVDWEVGEHPSGKAIVWGQDQINSKLWEIDTQPSEWRLLLRRPIARKVA